MIFNVVFAVLCVLCALLLLHQRRRSSTVSEVVAARDFVQFQRCYLVVYVCAVFGDWLQGPYVYALYAAYGFSKTQIALLFITGFGASGILGIFAGQAADKYGRCRLCCVYCVTYIVSCLTKHSANFYMLLFGRLTGGVATSILFSAFESWLVAAHDKRSFPRDLLSQTLSLATLLNSSAALAAAWLGALVRTSFDSLVAPFDLAIVFLTLALAGMVTMWPENKGEQAAAGVGEGSSGAGGLLSEALSVLKRDQKIVLLGLTQSCFEAAMYIFVFMWTPKLEALFDDLPHGQVFGCFMACCMIGSSSVHHLIKLTGSPVSYLGELYMIAALALTLPAVVTSSGLLTMVCFCVFEVAVGVYWPSIGIIKSQFVPEHVRATVYNLFRVPLNLIVVIALANLGVLSDDEVLFICGLLLAAAALFHKLFKTAIACSASTVRTSAPAHPHGEEEGGAEDDEVGMQEKGDAFKSPRSQFREVDGLRHSASVCPARLDEHGLESGWGAHASLEAGPFEQSGADDKGTSHLLPQ